MTARRSLGALLWSLVLPIAACTAWTPVAVDPVPLTSALEGMQVRVTRTDGTVVELREAHIERDSLIGLAPKPTGSPAYRADPPRERTAIALGAVRWIEARNDTRASVNEKRWAVVLGVALIAASVVAVWVMELELLPDF